MKNKIPTLTIGMPVFNDIEYIEASLNSVLAQSFTDFELIISDDGSTDGSGGICKEYAQKDKRVTYYRQPKNLGISKNMEWLLRQSDSKYFIWAGDDDLMHKDYLQKLFNGLESNTDCASAFAGCQLIDEEGKSQSSTMNVDYANRNVRKRIKHYIQKPTDYFGYGMFVRDKIKDVSFPVWWWPNKRTPYNNIYPTLVYYLCKGNYVHCSEEPLFFKRVKAKHNVNHELTGKGNAIKESFAFWVRKFNLVIYTLGLMNRARGAWFMVQYAFILTHHWFVVPSWEQLKLASSSFWINRVLRKNS